MRKGNRIRPLVLALVCCLAIGKSIHSVPAACTYADSIIGLSQTEKSMPVGESFRLNITGLEDNRATCIWSSSATGIATVNSRGIVTAVAPGSAVISCKITKSDKTAEKVSCLITVTSSVPTATPATIPTVPTTAPAATPATIPTPAPTTAPAVVLFASEPASGEAVVDTVVQLSGNTIQINFGKPVEASEVLGAQKTLSEKISLLGNANASDYGTLTGELSADKTKLTIQTGRSLQGSYVIMIAPGIQAADKSTIAKYAKILKFKDTTEPHYLGTRLEENGYSNLLSFDEEIDSSGLSVVAIETACTEKTTQVLMNSLNYSLSAEGKTLSINLNEIDESDKNKDLLVGIKGVCDLYGNHTDEIVYVTLKTEVKAFSGNGSEAGTVFATSDTVAPEFAAGPISVTQDPAKSSVLFVRFPCHVEETSAVMRYNYMLGDGIYPTQLQLVEQAAVGALVKLTFEEGVIPYDAEYRLRISGIKELGTEQQLGACEIRLLLAENVAPVFEKAYFGSDVELVLEFLEATELNGTPEFEVLYMGRNIALFSYLDGKTVRICLQEEITQGSVILQPLPGCQLTDTTGNMAVMGIGGIVTR